MLLIVSYLFSIYKNIIKNEIMAYYIGKIYLFLKKCGIDEDKMRFRQHQKDEMAHYADDCWDVECKISHVFHFLLKFSILKYV